jgi:hypothetical protein
MENDAPMAKTKKARKLTTEEALQALLGRKAAKRIRQVAQRLANDQEDDKKGKKAKKKR